MKISSIKLSDYTKKSNRSFGAKFSEELEYKYKKLGYVTFFKYGMDSKEYKDYETSMKVLKKFCPDGMLRINRDIKNGFGIFLQSPYIKSEQVFSAPYKYLLVDLKGLKETALNLTALSKGLYTGCNFEGPRDIVVEHIKHNIVPHVDRLFM